MPLSPHPATRLLALLGAAGLCLTLASAAATPLSSSGSATSAPGAPDLGTAVMAPDTSRARSVHLAGDGGAATLVATDASGAVWRLTLPPAALSAALDVRLTPLLGAGAYGSALALRGGVLIEPATELGAPAELTVSGVPAGSVVLLADADGRRLRFAPPVRGRPGSFQVSRLGALLGAAPAPAALADQRARTLGAAAAVLNSPVSPAPPPPVPAPGCVAAAEATLRHQVDAALARSSIDPERALLEQLAATGAGDDAGAREADQLESRAATRLLATVPGAMAGAAGGSVAFDGVAARAMSVRGARSLLPPAPATPSPSAPPASVSPRPDPDLDLPAAPLRLARSLGAWSDHLATLDAAALASVHDYAAPVRAAARARALDALGLPPSTAATAQVRASEHWHLVLDISVVSAPGAPPVHELTHLEADLTPAAADAGGSAHGRTGGGSGMVLESLTACAVPPVAVAGAETLEPGHPITAMALPAAFPGRAQPAEPVFTVPLRDRNPIAVDAQLAGTARLPGAATTLSVTVVIRLTHAPQP